MIIKEKFIKACAQAAAQGLLSSLVRVKGIELGLASEIAKDCADKFAQSLDLSLREHNFEIEP